MQVLAFLAVFCTSGRIGVDHGMADAILSGKKTREGDCRSLNHLLGYNLPVVGGKICVAGRHLRMVVLRVPAEVREVR